MALTPGTKLGPYEIQSPLGAGGMGEVYRATDTKLGRDIALKVLPAEMAQDPERLGRFRREAKALAQLDHPNIVTIHSVEECDGVHFLTMQLVEGLPLDRLIPQNGLALEQIVEIAGALGDALAAAHEKGIVHRDLKPANVMVSNEGRVKVLDFGLAKDVRASSLGDATMTSASQTQFGVVMGTPAYMSPEQTSGRPLDHRTDIFSMGVLLYEMATGHRPFDGSSSAELVSSILRDSPPSVNDSRPDLPSDLARVVRRCLEKDPRHRLQTARDVSNEFRDLSRQTSQKAMSATTSTSRAVTAADSGVTRTDEGFWVAVLPFKYSGSNADLAALAEGLTEDIVTGLSRFSYLRVIARNSTTRFANESFDVRSAGKELGARYVMEGSLRQAGTKLRLAVQLVDSTSGAHLWAETYVSTFHAETIFELQEELVPRIVATIADTRGVLPHSMSEALRGKPPDQLTPYEALLRSFAYFQRIAPEEHAMARTALERAVEQAPGNADAWAILSILYREEYTQGYNLLPEPLERAFRAAQRAIELAPSNHYGYHALASVMFLRGERQTFKSVAERALTLNPMDGFTLAYMGIVFAYSGDWERGCALAEKARSLNPHHPGWYWFPALLDAYRKGDYRNALDIASKVNMPGFWRTEVALAAIYAELGELDQARGAIQKLLAIRPGFASIARAELEKWWEPELVEQLINSLRKAGLETLAAGAGADQKISATSLSTPASRTVTTADSGVTRTDEGFWVAVLPFKYAGGNADIAALADGLSEDIITGLSRFSYLRVIARSSSSRYANEIADVRSAGKQLGARYVMEGSLRQAGSRLRLAVQLVDSTSGAHLWAETYDRTFQPQQLFELQDELVPRIVSTVGETHGVLPYSMSETLRNRDPNQLTPYEAVLRAFAYFKHVNAEEHIGARSALERAVEQAPGNADCWAMLAMLYREENNHGFNLRPDPVGRAFAAARRAVDTAPSNHLAHHALASVLFFRRERQAFLSAAQRAMELNPMDGFTLAYMGFLISYSGDWDRGCGLMEKARSLNPNHPGWYWFPPFFAAYRQGDYHGALELALKVNMPGFWRTELALAATYGQLGEHELAHNAARELLAIRPSFPAVAREELEKWWQPDLVEKLLEGLRKAGIEANNSPASSPLPNTSDSGSARSAPQEEGFWVAVLPFKYSGGNAELTALSEGLSEEVITGLSRFSYLKVIARGSTTKYSSESGDVRAIGKELGARYVMEGGLRLAGTKLRLAVQLVDAVSGAHLWAETYERTFSPDDIFALQDDLVPRIVSTVADQYGILPRSMSEALRGKSEESLTPQEAMLRTFSYFTRITPEEHAIVRRILERAVREAPDHADSWATLSMIYRGEFAQGYNTGPNPLDRALAAAQRAVDLAPTHALGHSALATVYFFRKEMIPFRVEAERALALNPLDAGSRAYLGLLIAASGEWDRGCEMVESAMQLNPNCPGYFYFARCCNGYRQGKYAEVLEASARVNMPRYFHTHAMRAAALGQLGRREDALKAVKDLLALRPDFAAAARQEYAKWYDSELIEQLIDGLRKAGLEIPEDQKEDRKAVSGTAASAAPSAAGPLSS
jgi:TolB-like protein/cytochrome c-type biogenesis protein CcmH/NrfG